MPSSRQVSGASASSAASSAALSPRSAHRLAGYAEPSMLEEAMRFLCCCKEKPSHDRSGRMRTAAVKLKSVRALADGAPPRTVERRTVRNGSVLRKSTIIVPYLSALGPGGIEAVSDGAEVCSCGNTLIPDEVFCRKCGKKAPQTPALEELQVLEGLEHIAEKLRGNMQKFPKKGKKLFAFSGPQMRYFALMPLPQKDSRTPVQRWKEGILGYWESLSALKKNEAPKGFVNLLFIVNVGHLPDDHDSKGILVKHKEGDRTQELVIIAKSEDHAKEWSFLMYEFIAKLRSVDG